MMKKMICLVMCLIMALTLLAACGSDSKDEDADEATAETAEMTDNTSETDIDKPAENGNKTVQTYDIKTPYCTLKYPAVWEDAVTVTENKKGDYTLTFTGKVDNKSFKLFDLVFDGKPKNGILLGTLKGDKDHTITMVAYDIDQKKCSDKQYQAFCGMQEDVNIIIDNLKKDYKFET